MNLTVFLLFTLKIRQTGSECIFARRKRNIQERFVFKVDLKGSRVDQIQNCGYFVLCFHSEVVWRLLFASLWTIYTQVACGGLLSEGCFCFAGV